MAKLVQHIDSGHFTIYSTTAAVSVHRHWYLHTAEALDGELPAKAGPEIRLRSIGRRSHAYRMR